MYFKNLIFLFSFLYFCDGYKILSIFPVPSHSHHTLASKLVKELAKRGHEVTFVSPFPRKTPLKNLKEISFETIIPIFDEAKKKLFFLDQQTFFENVAFLNNMGYLITENFFKDAKLQELLESKEHFDLIILPQFLTDGLLGIAAHFKSPLVLLSSMPLFSWSSFLLSQPAPPSYVPNLLSGYTGHMTFWQRFCNSVYDVYSILYHQWVVLPKHRALVKKYVPGEPDLYNFLNNASLLLINSHVSSYEATIQVPNVVEIGGFHLEEPKMLSEDLQKFMNSSVDGVVVFSMGTMLQSSSFPKEKQIEVLKAFSKLKQNVLWKWESEELEEVPKNVKLMKWLPQSDVLAHPNVKVFITHGGLLSTMESIYRGVPVIGIPVFTDQKLNMQFASSYGYGVVVSLGNLTDENLSKALNQILNDSRYKTNALRRSQIMKDRPIRPIDEAIYWVEYVIRHQGAPHLRYPGMDLNWFQRNLLDIVLFVLISIILTIKITFAMSRKCYKKKDNEKKNK